MAWVIALGMSSTAVFASDEWVINVDFQPGSSGAMFSSTHAGTGALIGSDNDRWNAVEPPVEGYTSTWGAGGNFNFVAAYHTEPLLDARGWSTPVTVTVEAGEPLGTTFAVNPDNVWAYEHVADDAKDLMKDYLIAPGGTTNRVLINNLSADERYTLYVFGAGDQNYHQTTFTVDGRSKSTAGVPHDQRHDLTEGVDYVVFEDVEPVNGTIAIRYTAAGESRDGNFNGFQLRGAALSEREAP